MQIELSPKAITAGLGLLSVIVSVWVAFVLLQKRIEYLEESLDWVSSRLWSMNGEAGPPPPRPHW